MYAAAIGRETCITVKERRQLHSQPGQPIGFITLLASPKFRNSKWNLGLI